MKLKTVYAAGLVMLVLAGCTHSTIGKVSLYDGKVPPFFIVGKTTATEVISRCGEPSGYREHGNRSVMIYRYREVTWYFPTFANKNYMLYLVFEDNVLSKAEVRKQGWRLRL